MSETVTNGPMQQHSERRVTLATLAKMARQSEPFACLTCYDASTARHFAAAGLHCLLVGDTAAEVVLGLPRTIDMDLGVLLALTAGVKRGCGQACVVMGDMPFMSYQADPNDAVRNAGRFLTEGLADIVKIEADCSFAPVIDRIVRAGVPVCGHIGSRPQRAAITGGYAAAGRTQGEADAVVRDAIALEGAGCSMLLIEAVPEEVTERVLEKTTVPVIGIGAGAACHGQVLVMHDLLGLSAKPPSFARPLGDVASVLRSAGSAWVEMVRTRSAGPSPYSMKRGH